MNKKLDVGYFFYFLFLLKSSSVIFCQQRLYIIWLSASIRTFNMVYPTNIQTPKLAGSAKLGSSELYKKKCSSNPG